tara:strand:+ start:10034 stop:10588 length:555 start_codon:yes stop_codon:yes gene_type:complete
MAVDLAKDVDRLIQLDLGPRQANWAKINYQAVANRIRLRQLVVFLGAPPRRAPTLVQVNALSFRYDQYSMRTRPRESLLESEEVGDVVLSFLCEGPGTARQRVREILRRIQFLRLADMIDDSVRDYALSCLVVLGEITKEAQTVNDEVKRMQLDIDFDQNDIVVEYAERTLRRRLIKGIDRMMS